MVGVGSGAQSGAADTSVRPYSYILASCFSYFVFDVVLTCSRSVFALVCFGGVVCKDLWDL